jgi:hypothetical protein
MYATYTPTFGNMEFNIAPSSTGQVNAGFGVVPYLSLESLVYQQQMQAQVTPTSILPGQNTGQQNVQGQYTVTDSTGNVRIQMGSGSF